jgi:hypothetical protein
MGTSGASLLEPTGYVKAAMTTASTQRHALATTRQRQRQGKAFQPSPADREIAANDEWAVPDSNGRPPACKAGALTS